MSCTNCYNGCTETVSDQCVRYTGISIPTLGISTGDPLSKVEKQIIDFLLTALSGEGIVLTIDNAIICEIVNKYLVECDQLTLPNVISAIIKAVCELQTRLLELEGDFAALEGSYTIDCLAGVTSTSGTHAILQATINKLCALEDTVTALSTNLNTNYVKIADLDDLIADYLASIGTSTKFYNRMVPFTVVEFYGSTTGKFDVSGAGIGDWEKIYLCNGNNGTPDKRGRVGVGATSGMGGGAMSPVVDPAVVGNPSYALLGTAGANTITLSPAQIPSHTHAATVNDPEHKHFIAAVGTQVTLTANNAVDMEATYGTNSNYLFSGVEGVPTLGLTSPSKTNVSVVNANTGGGLPHNNYQPGLGCYYIMYIP